MWLRADPSAAPKAGQSSNGNAEQEEALLEHTDEEEETGEADFVDSVDRRIAVPEEQDNSQEWGDELPPGWFSWQRLWKFTGPGFLMSIAYLDPGNLESDLQAGARTGYTLAWVLMWSTVMGYLLQMLAMKLGVATSMHLAQHCRAHYPPVPRIALWLMAEIAIIGSDIQEVIGSAIALRVLSQGAIPLWAGVLITALDAFLLLLIERFGVRNLEALFGVLIAIMAGSFGIMCSLAGVRALDVAEGLAIPRLPGPALQMAVAIVGAVIMPHNIYLHSALVHSRKIDTTKNSRKKEAIAYFRIESAVALTVSVVINVAVLAVFAKGFYGKGIADIGLENAANYLGNAFGSNVKYIWAVGLLAAGQSSSMTGIYTGQFVMSGFLDLHVSQFARITITRSVAIAPTLVVALLSGGQLDKLNEWLNVLQSIQLPFALIPVLVMTSSAGVMTVTFVNRRLTGLVCWAIAAGIVSINMSLIYSFVQQNLPHDWWILLLVIFGVVMYLLFIIYLTFGPNKSLMHPSHLRKSRSGRRDDHVRDMLLSNRTESGSGV
ncbi:hypothetical protein WJX74_008692 [Apatococcus lobatus]|uniref:Uncharacterized protein n=2 Tax=Apatococcus TaxID=904362 RepID=A0AAW1SMC8_9CHLO